MALQATDMASEYQPPDLKKTLSARVRMSTHRKLVAIRDLWREIARLEGKSSAEVEAIDQTFVVEVLLGSACDAELGQFGGYASTPEAAAAQLKALRESHKKTR